MSGILNIATTSLSVFQNALATTSNNIANAATEGYTRQRVVFGTRGYDRVGNGFIGNGVELDGFQRITDEFALLQMRTALSSNEASQAVFDQSIDLDNLLSNEATNISTSVADFFSALENLTDDPSYLPARQTLLSQGELVSDSFGTMYNQIVNQSARIDITIESEVDTINTYAQSLADLNVKLAGNATKSPDLLDQRDTALKNLASVVNITTVEQTDGSLLVTIGNGQVLVSGAAATALTASRNPLDSSRYDVYISNSNVTDQISGGKLGGLLSFRSDVLDVAMNRLGRMAINLSEQFNNQHQMGTDIDGTMGTDFFRDINDTNVITGRFAGNVNNTGTLNGNVTITDSTALTDANYRLAWDGANYTLTNLTTNATSTYGALPINQDGFRINLAAGAPAAGDTFLIRPTTFGANDIALSLADPNRVAMGQPMRAQTNSGNLGTAEISQGLMTNRATYLATGQPDLPITIRFTATNAYEIRDGGGALLHGGIPYNSAVTNDVFPTPAPTNYDPGFAYSITGSPQIGDTFTIEANTGGTNDNRNAFQLSLIPSNRQIDGGRYTIQEAYGQVITFVGNEANQASIEAAASDILLNQARDRVASISEVNLEEEAANLLLYQQMYQASTQLISVVNQLFDVITAALNS